ECSLHPGPLVSAARGPPLQGPRTAGSEFSAHGIFQSLGLQTRVLTLDHRHIRLKNWRARSESNRHLGSGVTGHRESTVRPFLILGENLSLDADMVTLVCEGACTISPPRRRDAG